MIEMPIRHEWVENISTAGLVMLHNRLESFPLYSKLDWHYWQVMQASPLNLMEKSGRLA